VERIPGVGSWAGPSFGLDAVKKNLLPLPGIEPRLSVAVTFLANLVPTLPKEEGGKKETREQEKACFFFSPFHITQL
jgi:hypothetical protein